MNTNDGASPKTSDIQCSATSYGGGTYEIELENQADSILLTPTRNGWSFVNWQDANGVELSVDNLIDSQTYYAQWIDDIKPALSVQVTANVASKQTATITATDAGTGVAAYYIGKQNPATTSVNFTNSASGTYTGSITSDSTWYFAVKDAAGNMQVSSKDFCKVMFGLASGETISPSTIVIEKGKQVTLPNPSKAGYSFKGWSNVQNPDIANISTFFTKVKVDNSMTVYPCFVDDIAPVLTVNAATGGIGSSGTISITNATEQGSGIAGYYIGQTKPNASGSNVTFGTTTSVTVNNSGAWYVVAKDKAGNLSGVQSFVYYQLTLNADGATNYTSNSAFIKSGTTVALPTGLTKTGYKADTWTGGISSITVSGNGSLFPDWVELPQNWILSIPIAYKIDVGGDIRTTTENIIVTCQNNNISLTGGYSAGGKAAYSWTARGYSYTSNSYFSIGQPTISCNGQTPKDFNISIRINSQIYDYSDWDGYGGGFVTDKGNATNQDVSVYCRSGVITYSPTVEIHTSSYGDSTTNDGHTLMNEFHLNSMTLILKEFL